ncbi:hypothetical protein GCM10009119_39590 [Algoriphagus jejuensis]|uniref:DUF2141 domain-containing protein n=1 Tax=Algoriphagus jejuensis TaxID=419934 RepID=A0ABN1N547_9BACT
MIFFLSLLSLLFLEPQNHEVQGADLFVVVQKTNSDKGKVLILVFDKEDGFPDQVEKAFGKFAIAPKNGKVELRLPDLLPGKYAVTVLHDEDNNEVMNTNFIGLPTEKYGFSNNPKIYFGPPNFEKAAVQTGNEDRTITINLR